MKFQTVSGNIIIVLSLVNIFRVLQNVSGQGPSGRFSDKEEDALTKFRPMVEDALYLDYMKNDWYLVVWLRASNMDIPKSEQMLRKAHQWRKEANRDALISQDWSRFESELVYHIDAQDREGRPIGTFPLGTWNMRKFVIAGQRNKLNLYLNRINDSIAKKARDTWNSTLGLRVKRDIPDWLTITDMNGFNLRQHGCLACAPAFFTYATDWDQYYPDLHMIYVVNTPRIFESILQVVRRLISEKANNALKVYGTNKLEWSAALNEFIDKDQLRLAFGGTKRV